ncbi:hypothetical protein [Streptomyces sp. NPDC002221]|uniref:hypothetical protein n=1 Tax=Streptomyces sp. NPDC002221 TaxID=3364639 RepID=UPI0036CC2E27
MDNAHFFFKKIRPDLVEYLVEICDEVLAKGPGPDAEWDRLFSDSLERRIFGGEVEALELDRYLRRPAVERARKDFTDFDLNRALKIVTNDDKKAANGNGTDQTSRTDSDTPGGTNNGGASGTDDATGTGDQKGGASSDKGKDGGQGGGCSGGWGGGVQGPASGPGAGVGEQGSLFVIQVAHTLASVDARGKAARQEFQRLNRGAAQMTRQAKVQKNISDHCDLLKAAARDMEDLSQKHRTQRTFTGVLMAAGLSPEDLGLTAEAVKYFDDINKAA